MHFLTDTEKLPAEVTPEAARKVDTAGFRHFCKSMAKVQEILCWAVVEHLLSQVDDGTKLPLGSDAANLCAEVRKLARALALCTDTRMAIDEGHLDCRRVAGIVQLLAYLPHTKIAAALHTTHLCAGKLPAAPFASFAAFLLNLSDAVESEGVAFNRGGGIPAVGRERMASGSED
jgi:hypothetical protein